MSKYIIYSECIAISEEVASFRAEIFTEKEQVAKANVIINRKLWQTDTVWLYLDGALPNSEIREETAKHCLKKAKKCGVEKRNKEIVLNLLKLNMEIEQISKVTGLTIEEIEKLKSEK